jgi:hypothetical protein
MEAISSVDGSSAMLHARNTQIAIPVMSVYIYNLYNHSSLIIALLYYSTSNINEYCDKARSTRKGDNLTAVYVLIV